jgi:DNA-binding response OmpR family regulator
LVVDDESDITFTLKTSLKQCGYSVDVYNDPIEALANFKPDYYDLLLLVVKMPKMNGFELYQGLAKIDTKAKVCFFTAYEELYDNLRKQFPNLKSECLITKPISILEVVKNIDKELL